LPSAPLGCTSERAASLRAQQRLAPGGAAPLTRITYLTETSALLTRNTYTQQALKALPMRTSSLLTRFSSPVRGKSVMPINTSSSLKRTALAIGGAALLLTATIGFTQAQTATPSANKQHQQAVINLAATKLGLTGDQLSEALKSARKDLGTNQGNRPQVGKLVRAELSLAATTLNYPNLQAMRKDLAGTTLSALATTRLGSPAPVTNALKADVDAKIQALVTAGTLKADRAATLKQKAEAKVDALMTRQFKARKTP
jgi:hypothetical protein